MLQIHLRVSKCERFGKGITVYIGKTSGPRCLVVAVVAYMATRGTGTDPFFLDNAGNPVV